jgi:Xaa-Pro aminopeptidase
VLRRAEADALLVIGASSRDPDLAPFTGSARLDDCFVLARRDGARWLGFHSPIEREEAAASGLPLFDPATLRAGEPVVGGNRPGARLARSLGIALRAAKIRRGRVALGGRYPNGELTLALAGLRRQGFSFVSGHDALQRLRRPKRGPELAEMREVAAGTAAAMRRVARVLSETTPARSASRDKAAARSRTKRGTAPPELRWRGEPLTIRALRREVASTLAAAGLEEPEGNLIAPGREGAVPHNTGNPVSVLHVGESLIVDLFPRRRLFADCTRTFCVGEPPPALAAAHRAVLDALAIARARARHGVRGFAIQEEVCLHFERLGHRTLLRHPATTCGYVHGLGHGVGFEVHELPHFRAASRDGDGTIERGDVFTLEPGLYDPEGGWAVRLEDLCHLGARGLENLTPLPYDLDPRAWPLDGG